MVRQGQSCRRTRITRKMWGMQTHRAGHQRFQWGILSPWWPIVTSMPTSRTRIFIVGKISKAISLSSRVNKFHPSGISATAVPVPAGFPWNLRVSRHPHSHTDTGVPPHRRCSRPMWRDTCVDWACLKMTLLWTRFVCTDLKRYYPTSNNYIYVPVDSASNKRKLSSTAHLWRCTVSTN